MLEHGHPEARVYPLGMLWDEANLVTERVNGRMVTEANLMRAASASSWTKKAGKVFESLVNTINVVTKPFRD